MARRIEIEVVVDSRRLNAGLREAQVSTNAFVHGLERTGRGAIAGTVAITGMGRAIAFASAQFLGGYGLLYALTASIKSAIEFQQQMVLIQTQAGGTAVEVQKMTKAVLQLAPVVGDTPEQLAKGLYHVESSGLRGAKALDTLRIAAEGAKLGGADLESVTSALVAAQQSGIKGAQNLGQAMGALDAIIGTGNLRMEDLAHALSSGILTSARAFGVSLNDVGAALSVLTVQGVPAQLAATRLRTSFSFLAAGTPAAEKALANIGLTTHRLGEQLRHGGIVPALELISMKLKASGLDAVQQGEVLTRAFGGARTATTIITLLQNIDQVQTHLDAINTASHNFAAKWEAEQKTARFATDKLKSTVVVLADTLGLAMLPTVNRVSNSLSHWLANTENQKRIQRDLTQIVEGTKNVAVEFYKIANAIVHTIGGWHNAVELLIALKLASWIVRAGEAARVTATYFWGLATAEQAVAAASGDVTAASAARAGAVGAGAIGASRGMSVAEAEAALGYGVTSRTSAQIVNAQRAAATQLTGGEGMQIASAAARREAAIAAMETGATGFGGARMLRTAGGDREILNAERLRLLRSQVGEDARVSELVKPGFAGAVRPGLTGPGGEAVFASGAAFTKFSKATEEATPRFASLISKFPVLGTEVSTASGALGAGGLVLAAGAASYALTSMALKATGASGGLHRFGEWLDGSSKQKPLPPANDLARGANLANILVKELGAGNVIPPQKATTARQLYPGISDTPLTGLPTGSANQQQDLFRGRDFSRGNQNFRTLDVRLASLVPTLDAHQRQVFIEAAEKALEKALHTTGLTVHAPRPTVALNMQEAAMGVDATIGPMPVSALAAIQMQLAEAQLEQAKGASGASAKIIKALREEIANDEAGVKTQERLIKKGIGSATQHAQTITKLYQDEASAYASIKTEQTSKKKDFALPIALQISQAQAANTEGAADDVSVAQQIVKFTQAAIAAGKFRGLALVAAIQEMGQAQAVIRAFNLPLKLTIAQAWAQTTTTLTDDIAVARQIRTLILQQIRAKKLTGSALASALGQLAAANQTIQNNFQIPLKLSLAQAKASSTTITTDDRAAAQGIKNFAEAYLKSKHRTMQGMIAAYDAITSANATLGGVGVKTAYEAPSAHRLTAGLGLTRLQRIAEEARIAQKEEHDGRRPIKGMVGALGFVVNANPAARATRGVQSAKMTVHAAHVEVHADKMSGSGGGTVVININGGDPKEVERTVLRVLQKTRRYGSPQRRGQHGGHTLGLD